MIELLIVVSIIGILASIAIPNFLQAQTRAKVARAKTEMAMLELAWNSIIWTRRPTRRISGRATAWIPTCTG